MISEAITHVADRLAAEGVPVFTDSALFYPDPVAALVGVPELVDRGMRSFTVSVPVHIVCAEALTESTRDLLFDTAFQAAQALDVPSFDLDGFIGSGQTELPAYTLSTLVTLEA